MFLVMIHIAASPWPRACGEDRWPPAHALAVATDIADALAAAHHEGIVHRALKPGKRDAREGRHGSTGFAAAKLLDFGLAKLKAPGPVVGLAGRARRRLQPIGRRRGLTPPGRRRNRRHG